MTPARMRTGHVLRVLSAAIVTVATLGACGVPTEGDATVIAAEELPFGLAADAEQPGPSQIAPVDYISDTEIITLYFPSGSGFVAVPRHLGVPVMPLDVVNALAEEPPSATNPYRSAVGGDDVVGVRVQGGVAAVELDRRFLDLPNSEQRMAVAQLVLSLTGRPGIGQISFEIGGSAVQVPRADGTLAKGTVSRDDFVRLLAA